MNMRRDCKSENKDNRRRVRNKSNKGAHSGKAVIRFDDKSELAPQISGFIDSLTVRNIFGYAGIFLIMVFGMIIISAIAQILDLTINKLTTGWSTENPVALLILAAVMILFIVVALWGCVALIIRFAKLYDYMRKSYSKRIVNAYCVCSFLACAPIYGDGFIGQFISKIL
jgi:hypothetical protein